MPFPPTSLIQKVHHPEREPQKLPVAPHAKRGCGHNPVPLNGSPLIASCTNPHPFLNTDISSRGIVPVSTVPGQFLATAQMTGLAVATVCSGNQPAPPNDFDPYNPCVPMPVDHLPCWPPCCPVEFISHEETLHPGFGHKAVKPATTIAKSDTEKVIAKKINLDPEATEFIPKDVQCPENTAHHTEEKQQAVQYLPVQYPKANGAYGGLSPSPALAFIADIADMADMTDSPGTSISVQQVLQLRHPGAARKTPHALKLLYFDCFDFHQKIRTCDSFDEKGSRIKLSRSELKKQHRILQNRLKESNSMVKLPPLNKLRKLPSADILLSKPTTQASIHPRSVQLSQAAASLDPVKFTEREKIRKSLAAHLASYKASAEEISTMKERAKTKEARECVERFATDDLWNLDFSIMHYYPYFDQKIFTLEAPFIRPVETIYCRSRLFNQQSIIHKGNYFEFSEEEEKAIDEANDSQLIETVKTISALAKILTIKLNQRVNGNTPVNLPETFSRQCILWHVQFSCDLVYKMIKLGEEDTPDITEILAISLDSLLDSIKALSDCSSEFPDEYITVTESLCLLLQCGPLQRLLSLQEAQVTGNIKKLWHHSLVRLKNTILTILVKSLQHPELLNTTMSLFKTLSDHGMFLTALADSKPIFTIRFARVTSEITNNLLKTLTNNYPNDISTHDQFVRQLYDCCSILNNIHQKLILKPNLVHAESQNLGDCIKTLHKACKHRLTEIEKARQDYVNEIESEKKNNHDILRANKEKREHSKQKQATREKRKNQLQGEITRVKHEPQEIEEPESDHAKLIKDMSKRLQLFGKKLEYGKNYPDELKTINCEFPEIRRSQVLAVWVFGDIAYTLCNQCTDKFNRAALFVRRFDKMKTFCADALEEAAQRAGQYDAKWLYDRDPNQPVSISSIDFLTRLSDPEQVQALIKRAFASASLYESALNRARDAAHQLTQDMMVDPVNGESDLHMYHLQQRVAFIIEEMNEIKQYLEDLQPVPDMSDLLATRKQLFQMLKTKDVADGQTSDIAGNQEKKTKNAVYRALLEKSESNWKVDDSVCDMRNSAEQQLEQVIKGFTELKTQLGSEGRDD